MQNLQTTLTAGSLATDKAAFAKTEELTSSRRHATSFAERIRNMKLLLATLVLFTISVQLRAQDFPNPKPTDAHKVLAGEAGIWDAELKMYFQGPNGPPTEYKAVETIELVSGGLYTRSTFRCKMGNRDFDGHGLFGYDPRSKEYTGFWVDNFSSIPQQLKGKYDAEKKTLTMFGTIADAEAGQEMKQKQVTTFVDENMKTFEIYLLVDDDGKELPIKLMELTAKRRSK